MKIPIEFLVSKNWIGYMKLFFFVDLNIPSAKIQLVTMNLWKY